MRRQVSTSVFLNAEELAELKAPARRGLGHRGARAFPPSARSTFTEMVERFGKG